MPKFAAVFSSVRWTAAWNCLFSSVGQSTWFVISGSLVRIRQEAQKKRSDLYLLISIKSENISGKFQSGQMGQTVNLLSFDFGGSNPSLPTHSERCGSSSVDRALAFQAEGRGFEPRLPLFWCCCYSSVVEHFLGKEEVAGSTPANSSFFCI